MSKQYKVYMYTNTVNNKRYVGVTCQTLASRAGKNGRQYIGSPYFFAAIQKYGWAVFQGEVLVDGLTKKSASVAEKNWITHYETKSPEKGYNLSRGGYPALADVFAEATRVLKIKNTLKQQRADTAVRREMSARMKAQWSDPEQRAHRLAMRKKSPSGKKPIALECLETGTVYESMSQVVWEFGVSKPCLSKRLAKANGAFIKVKTSSGPLPHMHFKYWISTS
jgi:hypothetical protein